MGAVVEDQGGEPELGGEQNRQHGGAGERPSPLLSRGGPENCIQDDDRGDACQEMGGVPGLAEQCRQPSGLPARADEQPSSDTQEEDDDREYGGVSEPRRLGVPRKAHDDYETAGGKRESGQNCVCV